MFSGAKGLLSGLNLNGASPQGGMNMGNMATMAGMGLLNASGTRVGAPANVGQSVTPMLMQAMMAKKQQEEKAAALKRADLLLKNKNALDSQRITEDRGYQDTVRQETRAYTEGRDQFEANNLFDANELADTRRTQAAEAKLRAENDPNSLQGRLKLAQIEKAKQGLPAKQIKAGSARLPNGSITGARQALDGSIQVQNPDGDWGAAPPGSQFFQQTVNGASTSDITGGGPSKGEVAKHRMLRRTANNFHRLATTTTEALAKGEPFLGGFTGAAVSAFNSIRAQAKELGAAMAKDGHLDENNKPISYEELVSVDRYKGMLQNIEGATQRTYGNLISMAYMNVRSLDSSGRVSDEDMRNSLKTFGVETNDPKIIQQAIVDRWGGVEADYNRAAEDIEFAGYRQPRLTFGKLNAGGDKKPSVLDKYR